MLRNVCRRIARCNHLRLRWKVLTVLTVVGVVVQLIGTVLHTWNVKALVPAEEQLSTAGRHYGGGLRSFPTTLDPHLRDYLGIGVVRHSRLDSTPARRLASTANRILAADGYPPRDTKDESMLYSERYELSPAQKPNTEEDEGPSEVEPAVNQSKGKQSPAQSLEEHDVPSDDELSVNNVVKQSPAQNQNAEELEGPSKVEAAVNQNVVKQSPAQNQKPEEPEVASDDGPLVNPEQVQTQKLKHETLPPKPKLPEQPDPRPVAPSSDRRALNPLNLDKRGTCHPQNHLVFLKTHKTASSTILNILYRYGDTRNLTFALPVNMHSQLYYPHSFITHFVEGLRDGRLKEFHIMCNHMRFVGLEVRKVMPVDTFYFSILRNPVSMMESIFTYYKSIPAFHKFKTLEEFLLDGGLSYNASLANNHYAHNLLTYDFGFDNSQPATSEELDRRSNALIAAVESNFHLILVSEYFDESMILLRHALCWTLEDVLSFRLNSRSEKSRHEMRPEVKKLIKQWNSLDWRLYQHFNATFWQTIDTTLGRDQLQKEVKLLRAMRAELEQACLDGGGAVDPDKIQDVSMKPFQYGSAVIQGYNIRPGLNNSTRLLCQRLITPELQYTSALYAKQFPDLFYKHQMAAKMAATKRLAAARRISTTTRHSAFKHTSHKEPQLKTKPLLHYAKPQAQGKQTHDIKSRAYSAAQRNLQLPSDPGKPT